MDDYAKLKNKLQLGKSSNIKYIDEKDMDNIENLNVDINLPKADRMLVFLQNVKNPYAFIVNGLKVKFEYSDKGLNINQYLEFTKKTMDDLEKEGLFYEEFPTGIDGICIYVRDIENVTENSIEIILGKYRSGLAAVWPEYKAIYEDGEWTIEVISMSIS